MRHKHSRSLRRHSRRRTLRTETLELRNLMASDTNAGIGLLAQYYQQANLTNLALTRIDSQIQFDWNMGSPDTSLANDLFSVRWSGQVEAIHTEPTTFHLQSDESARLWIDGILVIDRWTPSSPVDQSATVPLIAGRRYDLQLEYADLSQNANIHLEWSSPSLSRATVPASRLHPAERGQITLEAWSNIPGDQLTDLTSHPNFPLHPNASSHLTQLDLPTNQSDQAGHRLRGLLHPPETGPYTFYLAADEAAELWLSNSNSPTGLQRIASVTNPTPLHTWDHSPSQRSTTLQLVAGQAYAFEVLHKEGTGPDHLSVAWSRPSQSAIEIIQGDFLSPLLPTLSLYADNPIATEGSASPARVTFVRKGESNLNPLVVHYTLRGTATNGMDIVQLPGFVTIPPLQNAITLDITPLSDTLQEGKESLIVEIQQGPGYDIDHLGQRSSTISLQDDTEAPAGGLSLLAGTTLSHFQSFGGNFSNVTINDINGSNEPAIQVHLNSVPPFTYNAQLRQLVPSSTPIAKDDILFFEFYVRTVGPQAANGLVNAIFENNTTFNKSLETSVRITPQWNRIQIPFTSKESYNATTLASIGFHLGTQIQSLQFARMRFLNYGPSPTLQSNALPNLQNIPASPGHVYGSQQTIPVTGQSFTSARQWTTSQLPPTGQGWRLQGVTRNAAPVLSGDTLEYSFWARSAAGSSPRIDSLIQESFGAFTVLPGTYRSLTPSSTWQKFTYSVTTTRAYAANELQAAWNLGFALQTVEVADFSWRNTSRGVLLSNLPSRLLPATYVGRSGTDAWRDDADARIAQYRQGDLQVQVVDASGQPIDGAVVSIRQTHQAFKTGAAISAYNDLLSTTTTDPIKQKYQSEIRRLFNTVVIENNLKWPDFLNNRQLGIEAAQWAVNQGLYLRGHNIVWPSRNWMPTAIWAQYDALYNNPNQGPTAAADYLRATVRARVADAAATLAGKAGEWDVVNEPYANRDVMNVLGDAELLEWYRIFHQADPNGLAVLNDYDIFARNGANTAHRANFNSWIERLVDPDNNPLTNDGLLDIIGEQSHYNEGNLTDIPVFGQLLQQYATYNLPIAITEFDVNSTNEQLQADYLRDYMTMAFSQPSVNQFIHWGFWSESHWLPDAALYRADFSPKPNGQAYEDLIFGDWWSHTRGTTRQGAMQTRVFSGDFEVAVSYRGQSVTTSTSVTNAGQSLNITLPHLNTPSDIQLNPASIPENSPLGSVVGSLIGIDADANETFVFQLVPGPGDQDNLLFAIANDQLAITTPLDFESRSTYAIRVRATDSDGLSFEKSLTIEVTDANDPPTSLSLSQLTIAEHLPIGTPIGILATQDPDTNDTHTYALVSGIGDTHNAMFAIGGPGLNQLILQHVPDFELQSSYSIRIQSRDQAGAEHTQSFTIAVEDQPEGTALNDLFTLTYLSNSVTLAIATPGRPLVSLGPFPLDRPLHLHGLAGTDSLRIIGTPSDDALALHSTHLLINGHALFLTGFESLFADLNDGADSLHFAGTLPDLTTLAFTGGLGGDRYHFLPHVPLGSLMLSESNTDNDTLDFSEHSQGIQLDLARATSQVVTPQLTLKLNSASTFENVLGGSGDDVLRGNSRPNLLVGAAGDDSLFGAAGNDTYLFDADLPLGRDSILDTSGIDTLDYRPTSTLGIQASLALSTLQSIHPNHQLLLQTTSIENLLGSQSDDFLFGNTLANLLEGAGGNDQIQGNSGNDTYLFDADSPLGIDTLIDSVGLDSLDFSSTQSLGIQVNLSLASTQVINPHLSLTLNSATAWDHVWGSQANDLILGNAAANQLVGLAGDDFLSGAAGNDRYLWNASTQLGTDTISDTSGIDSLDFSPTTTLGVTVRLGQETLQSINPFLNLILTQPNAIENLTGTPKADTLFGNAANNVLTGGLGGDSLHGEGGNDTYLLDADLDLGSMFLSDTSGEDTLQFAATTLFPIALDLASTLPQIVTPKFTLSLASSLSFENIIGGSQNDSLLGNDLANQLTGGPGNDLLDGKAGDDTYWFDSDLLLGTDSITDSAGGFDRLDFSKGTTAGITLDLAQATPQVLRPGFLSLHLLPNSTFEHVVGTSQADQLSGDHLANVLQGGGGNDTLAGRAGNDILIGGTQSDHLLGGDDSDLLIAGTTSHDTSPLALQRIWAEWASSQTYLTRVANLRAGWNGLPPLTRSTTVRRDGANNLATGDSGQDWFFLDLVAGSDLLADLQLDEVIDEL